MLNLFPPLSPTHSPIFFLFCSKEILVLLTFRRGLQWPLPTNLSIPHGPPSTRPPIEKSD